MAPSSSYPARLAAIHLLLTLSSLLFITSLAATNTTSSDSPTALVLPITKNPSTLQYITRIHHHSTTPVPIDIILDLSSQFLWLTRDSSNNSSSSYRCHSTECSIAHASSTRHHSNQSSSSSSSSTRIIPTSCIHDICTITTSSSAFNAVMVGNLSRDIITLPSTDGITLGPSVSTPFLFSSTPNLQSFNNSNSNCQGIAGLGRNQLALPTQLANNFNFTKKFAICLPPSNPESSTGTIFFGDGPYAFAPGIDVSKLLSYTPLIRPNHTHHDDDEYFIWVRAIEVNGKRVPMNSTLLARGTNGKGGTKLSTVNPYTLMQHSIYKSFTQLFVKEARAANLTRIRGVEPFKVCYTTTMTNGFRPAMPTIDLIFETEEVFWRVFETNSMVPIGRNDGNVACLGVLDGGVDMDIEGAPAIVIGGRQLEDNLVQFDLENWRLGFTSTLLLRETSCADFDFTPNR